MENSRVLGSDWRRRASGPLVGNCEPQINLLQACDGEDWSVPNGAVHTFRNRADEVVAPVLVRLRLPMPLEPKQLDKLFKGCKCSTCQDPQMPKRMRISSASKRAGTPDSCRSRCLGSAQFGLLLPSSAPSDTRSNLEMPEFPPRNTGFCRVVVSRPKLTMGGTVLLLLLLVDSCHAHGVLCFWLPRDLALEFP